MKKNYFGLFSILIALFFCMTIYAQESVKLQYKFTKGKTYTYKGESSTRITQTMMGREVKVNTSTKNQVSLKVENVKSNGDASIIFSIDSIHVKTSKMGQETSPDLGFLLGKRLEMNFSKLGKLINFTEMDTVDDESRYIAIEQEAKHFLTTLPDNEVKIGGNWNSTQVDTMNMMGGDLVSDVDIVYTLAGKGEKLGHDCFKINYKANLKINGQGTNFTMDGTGTSNGEVYLDSNTGMPVYTKSNVDTKMNMEAQSMKIPMTQSTISEKSLIGD
jgi:hypothetical protein